jgi:hypothetical protein
MSITISDVKTNLDTYIGDTSTDRISDDERFQAITEATVWLNQELGNDHSMDTYQLNFLDTVNYYKITTAVSDLLQGGDLRRGVGENYMSATPKGSRDIAEDIAQESYEFAWAIERRNGDAFLAVNLKDVTSAKVLSTHDSLSAGGGTWEADTTNSDALNVTVDTIEKQEGSASLNFDIDVSQSGNNKATIQNTTLDQQDLSTYEDLGSWLVEVYIPDTANFTSFTLYWGSDTSNYWSTTVTTDIDGSAFSDGWNKLKLDWNSATKTSSPDVTAIDYVGYDFNYGAPQVDDTDFRIDNLRIANPVPLTFHYLSWKVGTDNSSNDITSYSATTDIPFYSGQYDQYRYPVAHKAASILFFGPLRLADEALMHEREAQRLIENIQNRVPASTTTETKNFKVLGINFNRRSRRRRR